MPAAIPLLASAGAALAAGGIGGITGIIVGAVVVTAISTLGALIFQPDRPKQGDQFQPTPYTKRQLGGTTPIVVGRRRVYGIEVYRFNDSNSTGASSRQFYFIIYSVGPVCFISETKVFGESKIFGLSHKVDGNWNTSVFAYYYGTDPQAQTGFGWNNISTSGRASIAALYDAYGLQFTPDSPYPVAHVGRAGINIFLAADSQGRSAGSEVSIDSVVDGILCRRFVDDSDDPLCYVADHNKWVEFTHNNKHYTGSIASNTYTAADLATAATTAMNNAVDDDDAGHAITFTVSYSSGTDKFTISSDTSGVVLLTWKGAHRDELIYDDLGILKGARYSFDPYQASGTIDYSHGGNTFDDIQLTGAGPYTVTSYFTFTKSYTRNPIRILYELRTNPSYSPGLERPDDFSQDLMLEEEKYCDGIVTVDSVAQYDIQPRNVMRMFDPLVSGTPTTSNITINTDSNTKNKGDLLKLVDGSYTESVQLVSSNVSGSGTVSAKNVFGDLADSDIAIAIPLNVTTLKARGAYRIKIYVNHGDAQTYTLEVLENATYRDCGTQTDVTGDQTIDVNFAGVTGPTFLRISNFSRTGGSNFAIAKVEMFFQLSTGTFSSQNMLSRVGRLIRLHNTVFIGNADATYGGEINNLMIHDGSLDFEFASVNTSTAGISFTFPFIRTIGKIVIATNNNEEMDYTIQYKATSAASWVTIPDAGTQSDIQGSNVVTFSPLSMIAFQITDFVRGDGSRPFEITEVEAYDAIPSRRYALDAEITSGERWSQILERLYESCFAIPCERAGKKLIIIERDEDPVQEINENHIIGFQKKPMARRDKVSQWILYYYNELKNYEKDPFVVDDFSAQLRDYNYPGGGTGQINNSRDIDMIGVTRPQQIARMGNIIRERARCGDKVFIVDITPGSLVANAGNIIRLTNKAYRVDSKLVRIQKYIIKKGEHITIECSEHTPEVYDDVAFSYTDELFQRNFVNDSGGSDSSATPGDASDVQIEFNDVPVDGTTIPQAQVTFVPPQSTSFSYANVWVNWNDATDAASNRVWKHQGIVNQGDISAGFPIDTDNSLDGTVARARVLLQSVSTGGSSRSVDAINADYEAGTSSAVIELDIPLDHEGTYLTEYANQLSSKTHEKRFLYPFTGDGTSDDITVSEYAPGTTFLFVNGQSWLRKSDTTSTEYWYEEVASSGDYTIIRPRYPIDNGTPCFVVYTPA